MPLLLAERKLDSERLFEDLDRERRHRHMTRKELCRLITEAGRVPVERDTLYNPIDRSKFPPAVPATPAGLVPLTL